ncbi:hypothetical protein EOL94_03900 [bacterium]|nr:hypothetical protein [bacterium]
MSKIVIVNDKMQKNYKYELKEPVGKNFHPDFKPELTPRQMLELGVFDGKYMTDCKKEFPKNWFEKAKLSPEKKDSSLNYFKISASQSLKIWKEKGWVYKDDPRGWFQWYCRYYMGRRIEKEDKRQIGRWKAIVRHKMAVIKNCNYRDLNCRPRQRQALLHWAYDSRKF